MLGPKNSKFRKSFKGRIHGNAQRGCLVNVGTYGLKALEPERINGAQLEAARRAVTRALRRMGRVIFRFVPDIPKSRKPQEVRMGGGKGALECYVFRVHPGRILIEVDGVSEAMARQALILAQAKLPIATRIVTRLWE